MKKLLCSFATFAMLLFALEAFAGTDTIYLMYQGTKNSPTTFHCEVKDIIGSEVFDLTNVHMKNHAIMVSGFNHHGELDLTTAELNTVYFKAYHDNNYVEPGKVQSETSLIQYIVSCKEGKGHHRMLKGNKYGGIRK